jgi:hypothetical protein
VTALPLLALLALLAACERRRALRAAPPDATARVEVAASPLVPDAPAPNLACVADVAVVEGPPCVTNEDCPSRLCFNANLEAQYSRALRDCPDARGWRAGRRLGTCVVDACARDADCPAGQRCGSTQMVPFPQRTCLPAGCRTPGICTAHGRVGQCFPYLAGRPCEHGGWACSFPDDECSPVEAARRCRATDGHIAYCIPVRGTFRCVHDAP